MGQSNLLLIVALVLVGAKLGGAASRRFGMPAVLGKLVVGVALGPAVLGLLTPSASLNGLADIGIILLMFIAGLETDVAKMRSVGMPAFLAATGGVALPMAAGAGLGVAFGMPVKEALFLGTVLTATSVGITAETLQELGRLQSREGSAILAAAVIDDIMGVVVLSVVLAVDGGGSLVIPLTKMALFLPLAFAAGVFILPAAVDRILRLRDDETAIALVIGIALLYAWSAEYAGGLAAVSGAYLAGLLVARTRISEHATQSIDRIAGAFFIPIFFVVIGLRMDSSALRDAPFFALALIAVAVVTKAAGCFAGALAGGFAPRDATRVGLGMVSRGEVALVVAVIGLDHGLVSASTFSAAILMTLVTTLATPLLLKWAYRAPRTVRQQVPAPALAGEMAEP
ncbi:MAG: cation:proton antiporter [Chloroflexota bacterium]|nr:cation:proton antiporter [Chloroflexota bacterium]